VNKKITYWIDLAEYDIVTATAMMKTKRYLYVGFMAHQAIEKILKAYFVKNTDGILKKSKELHSWIKQKL